MTENYRNWLPHGFDVLTPDETSTFNRITETIRSTFAGAGFREILLPGFDYAKTFQITTRSGGKLLFETRDQDGAGLSVRSDLTVQVIKTVAAGRFGPADQKLSYIQPVFQDRSWGSGHRRETYQAGVEMIGFAGTSRFEDLLELSRNTLKALGHTPRILYGDARFLEALFQNIPDRIRAPLAEAFHRKDTFWIQEMVGEAGLDRGLQNLLSRVPLIIGGAEALEELRSLCPDRDDLLAILDYAATIPDVVYDFSLVQELSYYTGPVFEGYIPETRERILSGGIYDALYREFSPDSGPGKVAAGFALDVSELASVEIVQPSDIFRK